MVVGLLPGAEDVKDTGGEVEWTAHILSNWISVLSRLTTLSISGCNQSGYCLISDKLSFELSFALIYPEDDVEGVSSSTSASTADIICAICERVAGIDGSCCEDEDDGLALAERICWTREAAWETEDEIVVEVEDESKGCEGEVEDDNGVVEEVVIGFVSNAAACDIVIWMRLNSANTA